MWPIPGPIQGSDLYGWAVLREPLHAGTPAAPEHGSMGNPNNRRSAPGPGLIQLRARVSSAARTHTYLEKEDQLTRDSAGEPGPPDNPTLLVSVLDDPV